MATERVAYVDSSALVKLVLNEPEHHTLVENLRDTQLVSSAIAVVEVVRACRVATPRAEADARKALARTELVAVETRILERAARLASLALRSLDAIHLATALEVEPDVLVAYDRRLLDAAAGAGLAVASPGA